jgi:hypothetical protein
LNALHSVDKEFVNKGTLRTFKASDDEKFQISSDHFNQFCTPPHLDENAEEGLTSCNVQQGQNKNFGSKKSHFHFKNRELFLQNNSLLTECKAFKTTPSKGSLHLGEELFCLSHDK